MDKVTSSTGSIVPSQSAMTAQLDKHNRDAKAAGKATVESRHYSVDADIVPLGGESFTSGTTTNIDRGWDATTDGPENAIFLKEHLARPHVAFPLEEFERRFGRWGRRLHELSFGIDERAGADREDSIVVKQ